MICLLMRATFHPDPNEAASHSNLLPKILKSLSRRNRGAAGHASSDSHSADAMMTMLQSANANIHLNPSSLAIVHVACTEAGRRVAGSELLLGLQRRWAAELTRHVSSPQKLANPFFSAVRLSFS